MSIINYGSNDECSRTVTVGDYLYTCRNLFGKILEIKSNSIMGVEYTDFVKFYLEFEDGYKAWYDKRNLFFSVKK